MIQTGSLHSYGDLALFFFGEFGSHDIGCFVDDARQDRSVDCAAVVDVDCLAVDCAGNCEHVAWIPVQVLGAAVQVRGESVWLQARI